MTIENILLLALIVPAAVLDYRFRKVPNFVIFTTAAAGLALAFLNGRLSDSMTGMFLGMALLLIPYAKGGIGAGDVKLLGAIGAIKGVEFVFFSFLGAAIIGGIMAVCRTAFIIKSSDLPVLRDSIKTVYYTGTLSAIDVPEYALKEKLPYAAAIAGGTIVILIMGI